MSCPNCGGEVEAGRNFCGDCGTKLGQACPACGAAAGPAQRFCFDCGTALGRSPPPANQPTAAVAEPHQLDTERRLVSVLFLDIANFTPFTESRDAEEVRQFVTRYFDSAKEIIERFGGTVDKYIGDAVMALWGASRAEEDDAERSVRAGLELVDMVAKLGTDQGNDTMAARAGIMTGEASVGPGGNDTGLVLGDIVNTASRLQSIGQPGDVLVGETTMQLTSRAISYSEVGGQTLKGKDDIVVVYRAERLIAERGGVGRADAIEAAFIGRDQELRLLKDQLHAASREQRAKLVSIVGQAGIGKSRLIWEFLKYIDGLVEDIYWHHGRSPSYSDGIAMWAIADMVRSRCLIAETEEPEVARGLLRDKLAELLTEEERAWVEPQLSVLLGIDPGAGERSELHAGIRLFFERLASKSTVVLVFEDLHWADSATLNFVEEFTEWSREHPILVVALARPDLLDQRPTWGSLQRGVVSLHLPQLADTDMHSLVSSLVPDLDLAARQKIVAPSGGVPLFAIEMIRMLMADGTLVPNGDGTFGPTADITALAVPDSINAVIGARLDRLDRSDRHLVQDAAVLGQTFTVIALSALSGVAEAELGERLASLARRELFELIRDPRSPERGQYGFVQSVIREVAWGRITKEVRRQKHVEVARYLESLEAEDVAGAIASHYLEAIDLGDTDPTTTSAAMSAIAHAVTRAKEVHSYEQIVSLAKRAEGIISDPAVLAPLWADAAVAAGAGSDSETSELFARQLLDEAMAAGDDALVARALGVWGELLNDSAQATRAVELLQPHYVETSDPPITEGHARFYAALARALMLTGSADTVKVATQALIVAEELDLEEVAAQALITRGTALADSRRPREGRGLIAQGVAIAKEYGHTSAYLRGLANSAYSARSLREAIPILLEGLAEARRVEERHSIRFFSTQVAEVHAYRGGVGEIDEMLEDPAVSSDDFARSQLLGSRSRALLNLGDQPAAIQSLEDARGLAAGQDDPQTLLWLDMGRVSHAVRGGDMEAARTAARSLATGSTLHVGNVAAVAWLPFLLAGDPELVSEYLGWHARLAAQSALSGYRMIAEAVAALLEGRTAAGLRLAELAVKEVADGWVIDDTCSMLALIASRLPPGADRDRYEARLEQVLGETPMPGLASFTQRILGGEFSFAS